MYIINVIVKYVLYVLVCEVRISIFSSYVSIEFRYGINLFFFLFFVDWFVNVDIIRLRVVRDLKY